MLQKKEKKADLSFSEIINNSPLPRLETEMLLSYLISQDRAFIIANQKLHPNNDILKKYRKLEKKRLKNWPIAYLTGKKLFFEKEFKVSPTVLIPRPETEIMVEEIIAQSNQATHFFDVGTGSGAIIISLAAHLEKNKDNIFKTSSFYASDISLKALSIASANAKKYNLEKKIIFRHGNLLSVFKKELITAAIKKEKIVIAANLPYLTPREMKETSISREPKKALLSGKDGLKHYRRLLSFLKQIKELKNSDFCLYCEINPTQASSLKLIVKQFLPESKTQLIKDLSEQDRFYLIKNIP